MADEGEENGRGPDDPYAVGEAAFAKEEIQYLVIHGPQTRAQCRHVFTFRYKAARAWVLAFLCIACFAVFLRIPSPKLGLYLCGLTLLLVLGWTAVVYVMARRMLARILLQGAWTARLETEGMTWWLGDGEKHRLPYSELKTWRPFGSGYADFEVGSISTAEQTRYFLRNQMSQEELIFLDRVLADVPSLRR